jgi:hypothetical protein
MLSCGSATVRIGIAQSISVKPQPASTRSSQPLCWTTERPCRNRLSITWSLRASGKSDSVASIRTRANMPPSSPWQSTALDW